MRCIICDSTDKWQNVDQYRHKASGMCICLGCSFVSYPSLYKTEEEIKAYYREDYRRPPTVQNLYTGQRKLHYHVAFLKEFLSKWREEKFESPVVCEIGAAYGMALQWFKTSFPKAQIYGTELTISYRRNAWWEYGINLTEDFDASRKYDMIMSYKVAEHQIDVDKKLRQYVECLSEKGHMYISVPIWFDMLNNFGKSGFELEYYYDTNHINVWTKTLFETLLNKVGLEVVKFNDTTYDNTYLCKRNDSLMDLPAKYEDPNHILDLLSKIKQASLLFEESNFDEATKIYPNFPDAHMGRYEKSRGKIHHQGFDFIHEEYLERALKECPKSADTPVFIAETCIRYEKYDLALKYLDLALKMKPENVSALLILSNCYRQMSIRSQNEEAKRKLLNDARGIMSHIRESHTQNRPEAISWIYNDNAKIPTPHEMNG